MDEMMRFFSYLGEGDQFFYMIAVLWAKGHWYPGSTYMYDCLFMCFFLLVVVELSYILKT